MKIAILFLILFSLFSACNNSKKFDNEDNNSYSDKVHTSENSLDWNGVYRGTLPCADCEGIKTEIFLKKDFNFEITKMHIGKDDSLYRTSGSFNWNDSGNIITLTFNDNSEPQFFRVIENAIIMLDKNMNAIEGELADKYIFQKYNFDKVITEKYWKLIKLYDKKIDFHKDQKREAHVILRSEKNMANGSTGCNMFNGSYKLEKNNLSFSPFAVTKIACPHIDYEHSFLKAFAETASYEMINDTLKFLNSDNEKIAIFESVYFR